jgi:IclR family pca regulon transcriptional regulator
MSIKTGAIMAERRNPVENEKNKVRSAGKVLTVLSVFKSDEPELTLPEIARRTALDRGTVFRIVHTLVDLGYLRASGDNKRFRLTLKCLELGYNALVGADLRDHVGPILRELVPDVSDAASYGVLDRDDVVYIVRIEGSLSMAGLDRRPGSRTKAYAAALGHAILAFLPREEQIARLNVSHRTRFSEKTLVDLEELLERLEVVKDQGYAVSDGENAFGLRTVAAPVFDTTGAPVGGVSLTVTSERMDINSFVELAVPVVQKVAEELSIAMKFSFGRFADGQFSVSHGPSRR